MLSLPDSVTLYLCHIKNKKKVLSHRIKETRVKIGKSRQFTLEI